MTHDKRGCIPGGTSSCAQMTGTCLSWQCSSRDPINLCLLTVSVSAPPACMVTRGRAQQAPRACAHSQPYSKNTEGWAAGRGARETAHKSDMATSSRHRDIQPAVIGQEPNVATGIGAHKRHDDGLLFPPLEAIHRANLHMRVLRLDLSPQESHLRTLVVNICPAPLLM